MYAYMCVCVYIYTLYYHLYYHYHYHYHYYYHYYIPTIKLDPISMGGGAYREETPPPEIRFHRFGKFNYSE